MQSFYVMRWRYGGTTRWCRDVNGAASEGNECGLWSSAATMCF